MKALARPNSRARHATQTIVHVNSGAVRSAVTMVVAHAEAAA